MLVAILAANAMVHKQTEFDNVVVKQVIETLGPMYYMLNSKKRKNRAQELITDPN